MRSRQEGVGRKAKEEACLLSLLTSFVFVRLRSSSFVFVRLRSSCLVLSGPYRLAHPSRHAVSYGRLVIRLLFRLCPRGVSFIFSSFRLVPGRLVFPCCHLLVALFACSFCPGGFLLRWCPAVLSLVPLSRSHRCVPPPYCLLLSPSSYSLRSPPHGLPPLRLFLVPPPPAYPIAVLLIAPYETPTPPVYDALR